MKPHVLLVGGKDSAFASIAELGVRVTLLQKRADLTQRQVDCAARLVLTETINDTHARAVARAVHAVDPFHAVVSFSEACLSLTACIGEQLGVPHNPRPAVERSRNKVAMRALLAERGLPSARYRACWRQADVEAFRAEVGTIILKPSSGSGSRGVTYIDSPGDVEPGWEWCTAGGALPAIAEEFLTGREYSVESLTVDGAHQVLMVTEKLTSGPPAFVETGHQMPARLPAHVRDEVARIVLALLDALGHRWGPAHTEVMIRADGRPAIIETQTRFGGDQIWEMTQHVTGVPLAGATVAALVGLPDPSAAPAHKGAAIRFFAPQNAVIGEVTGADAARAVPGVERVNIRAKPGTKLGRLRDSWSRQGYVLAYGPDTDTAIAGAEAAAALLNFDLKPLL